MKYYKSFRIGAVMRVEIDVTDSGYQVTYFWGNDYLQETRKNILPENMMYKRLDFLRKSKPSEWQRLSFPDWIS